MNHVWFALSIKAFNSGGSRVNLASKRITSYSGILFNKKNLYRFIEGEGGGSAEIKIGGDISGGVS